MQIMESFTTTSQKSKVREAEWCPALTATDKKPFTFRLKLLSLRQNYVNKRFKTVLESFYISNGNQKRYYLIDKKILQKFQVIFAVCLHHIHANT